MNSSTVFILILTFVSSLAVGALMYLPLVTLHIPFIGKASFKPWRWHIAAKIAYVACVLIAAIGTASIEL